MPHSPPMSSHSLHPPPSVVRSFSSISIWVLPIFSIWVLLINSIVVFPSTSIHNWLFFRLTRLTIRLDLPTFVTVRKWLTPIIFILFVNFILIIPTAFTIVFVNFVIVIFLWFISFLILILILFLILFPNVCLYFVRLLLLLIILVHPVALHQVVKCHPERPC